MEASTQPRDSRGRFVKAQAEIDLGENGNNFYGYYPMRNNREIGIRVPMSEYIPFFCLLLCFLIVGFPWLFAFKTFLKNVCASLAKALISAFTDKEIKYQPKDDFFS